MEIIPTKETPNSMEHGSQTIESELIKKRFLQIKYPLSKAGLVLKARILEGQEVKEDELPTVENPRNELFEDFDLDEEEKHEIFGRDLSNVQVTKGCRHKCTFCAAGAAGTVDSMPFPAIVKIAQEKKRVDTELMEALTKWQEDIVKETGYPLETIARIQDPFNKNLERVDSGLTMDEESIVANKIGELFKNHPFRELLMKIHPEIVERFDTKYKNRNKANWHCFMDIPIELGGRHFYPNNLGRITNYYDSDPFDYKDRTFLHNDGSVADFGDVARLLSSEVRPIHVTTAGWSKTDKIAQGATEKIVAMGPNFFNDIRLSVNQYEVRAKKDMDTYVADTINSIITLAPLGLKVLIFDNKSDPAYTAACAKIETFINKKGSDKTFTGKVDVSRPVISTYSGHIKNEEGGDDHHDVMACMPGFHIWPNGTIAKQQNNDDGRYNAPKGSRPTPICKKMWRNVNS